MQWQIRQQAQLLVANPQGHRTRHLSLACEATDQKPVRKVQDLFCPVFHKTTIFFIGRDFREFNAAERLKQTALLFLQALEADSAEHARKQSNTAEQRRVGDTTRFLYDALVEGNAVEAFLHCLSGSRDPTAREILVDILIVLGLNLRLWQKRSNVELLVLLLHDRYSMNSIMASISAFILQCTQRSDEG